MSSPCKYLNATSPLPPATLPSTPSSPPQSFEKPRPAPLCIASSPSAPNTMRDQPLHSSGAITPPPTPITISRDTPPGSDPSYLTARKSLDVPPRGMLLEFAYQVIDYDMNGAKLLGSGLWSDVYLARPCETVPGTPVSPLSPSMSLSTSPSLSKPEPGPGSESDSASKPTSEPADILTPPITPVKHRHPSLSLSRPSSTLPPAPSAYAIKLPASRSAKAVLAAEAKILSYLTFLKPNEAIVPFYGLDPRKGSVVMAALPQTLETFVTRELNTLSEPDRAERLREVFPSLARGLVRGLEWLGEAGCIHADIKPANVLLTAELKPVYADFSSAILTSEAGAEAGEGKAGERSAQKPTAPLGGGTWDCLCPSLLVRSPSSSSSSSSPATPSPATDLYALAITLLFVVIGCSPFDAAGRNVWRRREMVKLGRPLDCAFGGEEGSRNEQRMQRLGGSVRAWLSVGLRGVERRVDVTAWREALEKEIGD